LFYLPKVHFNILFEFFTVNTSVSVHRAIVKVEQNDVELRQVGEVVEGKVWMTEKMQDSYTEECRRSCPCQFYTQDVSSSRDKPDLKMVN